MDIIGLPEIHRTLNYSEVIDRMREALMGHSRGECDTPMPMHLDIRPERGEVHIKSSYRRGGKYFALKVAGSFPGNLARGLSTSSGMMLLFSAETGQPVAVLADEGHLTDVRTAAAAAMTARALGRSDERIGILGTGIQARLQAAMHAKVLDLVQLVIWGRTPTRLEECCRDLERLLPNTDVIAAGSPEEVARATRLIITCTASRAPLLRDEWVQPGTLISAVGSDSPGKQELDPAILGRAALILADSRRQCEKLGELQHAPAEWERALEIGEFCAGGRAMPDPNAVTVCDFTGLGVEDLYIAEYCYERSGK